MEKDRVIALAKEAGFAAAEVISTNDLKFAHEFRKYCEDNACGNYNRNYGCPPYCGTPQEMEDKVMKYRQAVVFQSKTPVEDVLDNSVTKKIKKKHTQMTMKTMEALREHGLIMDGMPIMAGPCNLCDTCGMPEGKPCIHEQKRFSCLSAYCVDAVALAQTCGMEMKWNGDVVSFFSLYLFDRAEEENQ